MEIIAKIKNQLEEIKKLTTKEILNYLKIFAFLLLILLILIILFQISIGNAEKTIGLISALGILISALLASYSVMLNIENTNHNEEVKKESDKKASITFFIQNLIDLTSVFKKYENIDIGDEKMNTINTIYLILERKLNNIENKDIQKILSDEESNLFIHIRLRLYESIGILNNYKQSILLDNPKTFNENIKFLIDNLSKLIELLSENHNIPMYKNIR